MPPQRDLSQDLSTWTHLFISPTPNWKSTFGVSLKDSYILITFVLNCLCNYNNDVCWSHWSSRMQFQHPQLQSPPSISVCSPRLCCIDYVFRSLHASVVSHYLTTCMYCIAACVCPYAFMPRAARGELRAGELTCPLFTILKLFSKGEEKKGLSLFKPPPHTHFFSNKLQPSIHKDSDKSQSVTSDQRAF